MIGIGEIGEIGNIKAKLPVPSVSLKGSAAEKIDQIIIGGRQFKPGRAVLFKYIEILRFGKNTLDLSA